MLGAGCHETALADARDAYAHAASLDGGSAGVYLLWADAAERAAGPATTHGAARAAAAAAVHRAGVAAGVWALAAQRPVT